MADVISHASFVARQYNRDAEETQAAAQDLHAKLSPAKSIIETLKRIYPANETNEKMISYCECRIRAEVRCGMVELIKLLGGPKGRAEMLQILDQMRVLALQAKL